MVKWITPGVGQPPPSFEPPSLELDEPPPAVEKKEKKASTLTKVVLGVTAVGIVVWAFS